jgi:hypothetical protein
MSGSHDRIIAFPSLVRDKGRGQWKVREMKKGESPRIDLKGREMIIPFGDTELEQNARQHEMGHAAWTGEKLMEEVVKEFGVSQVLVQGIEDARINTNLGNLGLPQDAQVFDEDGLEGIHMMRPEDQLALLFATIATGDEEGVREAIEGCGNDMVVQFADHVMREAGLRYGEGEFNTDEVTRTAIRLVTEWSNDGSPPPPEDGEGEPGDGEPGDGGTPGEGSSITVTPGGAGPPIEWKPEHLATVYGKRPEVTWSSIPKGKKKGEKADYAETAEDRKMKSEAAQSMVETLASVTESADGVRPVPSHLVEDTDTTKDGTKLSPEYASGGAWAPMDIVELARPDRVPARIRGRARGVNDTGAIPVAMHRITSDGRVFRASRIKPMAGAVLIDNSGSMGFKKEDLLRIMAALPAATIADYCSSGSRSELRILARKGRMVAQKVLDTSCGSGNGCDGLALRWLVQQPGPRFWVADGGVTGLGDQQFIEGSEECLVLCKAGKVAQFFSIEQLEKMLEEGTLSLRRHPPLRDRDRPPYRLIGLPGY